VFTSREENTRHVDHVISQRNVAKKFIIVNVNSFKPKTNAHANVVAVCPERVMSSNVTLAPSRDLRNATNALLLRNLGLEPEKTARDVVPALLFVEREETFTSNVNGRAKKDVTLLLATNARESLATFKDLFVLQALVASTQSVVHKRKRLDAQLLLKFAL
jgi:hypothetical protein